MKLNRRALRRLPIAFVFLALLLLASVPAVASAASAPDLVTQISLAPRTPNVMPINTDVDITFDYTTTEAGGVRIFARPFTGGALTPNYAAHGSPLYPVGSGSSSGFFTITSGNVTVDHIRFEMWNASQTTRLYVAFIPVSYKFRSATTNRIGLIGLTATPNILKFKQKVSVSFQYKTTRAAGVRIFARPLTSGSPTPHYAASGSPLYAVGTGSGSGWFTVTKGTATVTKIRLTMWNATRTKLLFTVDVPVSYAFKPAANIVNSIKLTPANPNILKFGENVGLTFKYTTTQAGGVRIWARPFTSGALTPNYGAHGSPIYPIGTGAASGFFTISDGTVRVDQIRLQMWNAAQTKLLFQAKIPVSYQFK
ncbi:MAG: hypothetical protein WC709_12785 [Thermoleophilia bacterium]